MLPDIARTASKESRRGPDTTHGVPSQPVLDHNGHIQWTPAEAAAELRRFLEKAIGSSLQAWLWHFDKDCDHSVSLGEFLHVMWNLKYSGNAKAIFRTLDSDRSGELSLEEVDPLQARIWRDFRAWGACTFTGSTEFIERLSGPGCPRKQAVDGIRVTKAQFSSGLEEEGWEEGYTDLLFKTFDTDCLGYLTCKSFKWLDAEISRARRMEQAKKRVLQGRAAAAERPGQAAEEDNGIAALEEFKLFLKQQYGSYVRAWRCALAVSDSMVLQKLQFFKACTKIGWSKDVRVLWKAFDKDDSGHVTIDELDERSAAILAKFCFFIREKFGTSVAAFNAFKKNPTAKKVDRPDFQRALKANGFNEPSKLLFHGLDRDGTKYLCETDMLFLDKWRPLPFLLAKPNVQAMLDFKKILLKRYKSYLKAWRHLLDKDGSNHCNWYEFEYACKTVGFTEDVPGAWRALDEDVSGFITLLEIDPESNNVIVSFKRWAEDGFGNVVSAFGVFDNDQSNSVDRREFCRACRIYGYHGDPLPLFKALDVEMMGALTIRDVAFLDNWVVEAESYEDEADAQMQHTSSENANVEHVSSIAPSGPSSRRTSAQSEKGSAAPRRTRFGSAEEEEVASAYEKFATQRRAAIGGTAVPARRSSVGGSRRRLTLICKAGELVQSWDQWESEENEEESDDDGEGLTDCEDEREASVVVAAKPPDIAAPLFKCATGRDPVSEAVAAAVAAMPPVWLIESVAFAQRAEPEGRTVTGSSWLPQLGRPNTAAQLKPSLDDLLQSPRVGPKHLFPLPPSRARQVQRLRSPPQQAKSARSGRQRSPGARTRQSPRGAQDRSAELQAFEF